MNERLANQPHCITTVQLLRCPLDHQAVKFGNTILFCFKYCSPTGPYINIPKDSVKHDYTNFGVKIKPLPKEPPEIEVDESPYFG